MQLIESDVVRNTGIFIHTRPVSSQAEQTIMKLTASCTVVASADLPLAVDDMFPVASRGCCVLHGTQYFLIYNHGLHEHVWFWSRSHRLSVTRLLMYNVIAGHVGLL